jgi:hypothetical protein
MRMAHITLGNFTKEINMAMVFYVLLMDRCTWENGKTMTIMEWAYIFIPMDRDMRVSFLRVKSMEWDNSTI